MRASKAAAAHEPLDRPLDLRLDEDSPKMAALRDREATEEEKIEKDELRLDQSEKRLNPAAVRAELLRGQALSHCQCCFTR